MAGFDKPGVAAGAAAHVTGKSSGSEHSTVQTRPCVSPAAGRQRGSVLFAPARSWPLQHRFPRPSFRTKRLLAVARWPSPARPRYTLHSLLRRPGDHSRIKLLAVAELPGLVPEVPPQDAAPGMLGRKLGADPYQGSQFPLGSLGSYKFNGCVLDLDVWSACRQVL